MKPKLVKSFNKDEENYFKIEVKDINSHEYEKVLVKFLEELGFHKPFYAKITNESDEEAFSDKTYKQKFLLRNPNF